MWLMTMWRLMLEIWTVPSCDGACNQGRKECRCRKK
jgi:hypothetical protein